MNHRGKLDGGRYKAFPPGRWNIRVPVSSRAAAKAAMSMYAPCRPTGYALQSAAWGIISTVGPRLLPGRSRRWHPPIEAPVWQELWQAWARRIGPFDGLAIHEPAQPQRSGFTAMLLAGDECRAVARVRPDAAARYERELRTLTALRDAAITSFWHPIALGMDSAGGWDALLLSALPAGRHRPVTRPDLQTITDDVQRALAPVLERGPDVPDHWLPMHGDLTPWNVRTHDAALVAVLDWEDVTWGPPGADSVLFRAAAAALWNEDAGSGPAEAVEYWLERFGHRTRAVSSRRVLRRWGRKRDKFLRGKLVEELNRMAVLAARR